MPVGRDSDTGKRGGKCFQDQADIAGTDHWQVCRHHEDGCSPVTRRLSDGQTERWIQPGAGRLADGARARFGGEA
jgi:hypothetical protein